MAWIAFTVSFALPKLNYILAVLNDPFGWGWHLLGLAGMPVMQDMTGFSAAIQVGLLLIGLYWSVSVSRKFTIPSDKRIPGLISPVVGFQLLFSVAMLWLLVG
jgi:hypothetical protein